MLRTLPTATLPRADGTRGRDRPFRPMARGVVVAPFFVAAVLFLLVAGSLELVRSANLPLIPDLSAWHWPIVHLAFVGGATQLIIGSMVFFGMALLMANAPPDWLMRGMWVLNNVGALALAGGVLLGWPSLAAVGGIAVLGALIGLLATLRLLRRRSLARHDPTLLYYQTAIVFLLVGGSLGVLMLLGLVDSVLPRGQVRLAHLHLNLVGWITLTIVGTMRLFFGTVLGTRPRRLNPLWAEYWPLTVGTVFVALGWLAAAPAIVGLGTLLQTAALLAYGVAILQQWRGHTGVLSLAGGHLLAATFWLIVMTLGTFAVVGARSAGAPAAASWTGGLAAAGFLGFIGQTILGALTHLFPIVVGLPTPARVSQIRSILEGQRRPQLVLANAAVGALVLGLGFVPTSTGLASVLTTLGLAALAATLALVVVKAGRVVGILVGRVRQKSQSDPTLLSIL